MVIFCSLLAGIRSVSFNENILTIGTGLGNVLFYDMNAGKYLHCHCGHICVLNAGSGYLVSLNLFIGSIHVLHTRMEDSQTFVLLCVV